MYIITVITLKLKIMIEQKITIQNGNDPLDTYEIIATVPNDVKILSTEPDVIEKMAMYGISDEDIKSVNQCELQDTSIVRGIVSSLDNQKTKAYIDIGSKYTATCNLSKEPEYVLEQLAPGLQVDVKLKNDQAGNIYASIIDALNEGIHNNILESIGDKSVGFTAKVKELIYGGYWLNISGITCFMPGSLAGLNKLHDFESLVGKEIIVMPITYSRSKNTIVVSHREYLTTLIPGAIEHVKENDREMYTGFVTGTAKFGVFVEFNKCLTGLIPKDDLDEKTLKRFENRDIKPGDDMSFWLNEILSEKKIILTQLGPRENIWDTADEKYKPMMVTIGTVTKVTAYGAFVELEKGISGLIHKSKLRNYEPVRGERISIKIQSINTSSKRITLALPLT